MPLPDSLLLSISGILTHPYDFTFYKNNGEIANRIRAGLEKKDPSPFREISVDSDNDIVVKTDVGTFFVTPTAVTSSGWSIELKNIQGSATILEYARAIDFLADVSSALKTDWYSVRLLFRFTPENGLDLLKPRIIDPALQTILAAKAPRRVYSFKNIVRYLQGQFSDILELEVSEDEIQLWYGRNTFVGFDSYHAFLQAANLNEMVGDVASFLSILEPNESRPGFRKPGKP